MRENGLDINGTYFPVGERNPSQTALQIALNKESPSVVKALIDAGLQNTAILNEIDNAIRQDDGDTVVWLMRESGLDINGTYFPVDRNDDYDSLSGYEPAATALHRAVRAEKTGVVKALLDAGADINARNENGQTVLFVYDVRDFRFFSFA